MKKRRTNSGKIQCLPVYKDGAAVVYAPKTGAYISLKNRNNGELFSPYKLHV